MSSNSELINCELIKDNRIFLITPSPNERLIKDYIKILKEKSINLVIKATYDNLYNVSIYNKNNIEYIELQFDDGSVPTDDIILKLIEIIKQYNSICIHCLSGLGRAPVLMALILILQYNYKPIDAVIKIKKKIIYAFNTTQLEFLFNFKKSKYIKKENKCEIL